MGVITRAMRHDVVLWRAKGRTGTSVIQYDHPVQIKGRWTDGSVEYVEEDGTSAISTAQCLVDRDVKPCDLLRKGTLKSVPHVVDPTKNTDVYEVRAFNRVEKLRASTEVLREAIMKPNRV